MALSNDVQYIERNGEIYEFGVLTNVKLYGGAMAGLTAAMALVPAGHGDAVKLVGFVEERVDNTGGATGAVKARIRKGIRLIPLSAAVSNIGAAVYASDDGTFTLTAGSLLQCGTVHMVDAEGTWLKTL